MSNSIFLSQIAYLFYNHQHPECVFEKYYGYYWKNFVDINVLHATDNRAVSMEIRKTGESDACYYWLINSFDVVLFSLPP